MIQTSSAQKDNCTLSYCAEDVHTVQKILCKWHAQKNKLDSLLCTAILGIPGNLEWALGLRPWVILGYLRQPRLCMCRRGYLVLDKLMQIAQETCIWFRVMAGLDR